jgi:hypothetical protein
LGSFLCIVIVEDVVEREQTMLFITLDRMFHGGSAADWRICISDSIVEAKRFPIANQLSSLNDPFRSEKVEASSFVVVAEYSSVRMA